MIFWQRRWLGFCPCPKNMLEAKLKCLGPISLAEEISGQPVIDSVVWQLAIALMQTYSEEEQVEQKKIQF